MGAYPALYVNPPQDPTQGLQRALTLRNLLQQQPLELQQRQQAVQSGQLQLQQQQMAVQDMQKIQQIAPQYVTKDDNGKATGYDFDGLEQGAIAAGVRPQSLAQLQTMRKSAADILYTQAQTQKDLLDNQNKQNDQMRGHLEAVRSAAPQDRPAAYQDFQNWAKQNKLDTSHLPPQLPGTDDATLNPWLDQREANLAMGSQLISEAKERAATAASNVTTQAKQREIQFYQNLGMGAPGVPAETMGMADYLKTPPTKGEAPHTPANYAAWKAKQEAIQTAPEKEAVARAEGQARAATEVNMKRQELSDTQYQQAIGADQRLNRMETSYKDATQNNNQQAMLALLTDHIGMTLGLQKGARITKDILNEAQQSQPWLSGIAAKFDSDGLLSGVTLGKQQMQQMMQMGYSQRENAWDAAAQTSKLYRTSPPPGAVEVYGKRDPNARVFNQQAAPIPQGATGKAKGSDGNWYYHDSKGKILGPAQ